MTNDVGGKTEKSASPNQQQEPGPSRDADSALSARVDEQVFGHRVAWRGNFAYRADVLGDTQIRDLVADCYALHAVVPDYATDIAAAWLVVREMERRGATVVYRTYGPRLTRNRIEITGNVNGVDAIWAADAADAPLAICRAALLAVEAIA